MCTHPLHSFFVLSLIHMFLHGTYHYLTFATHTISTPWGKVSPWEQGFCFVHCHIPITWNVSVLQLVSDCYPVSSQLFVEWIRDKKLQIRTCYLWYVQCIKIIISLTLNVSVALSCTPHSTPWIFYNNSLAVSPDGDSSATLLAEFNFMPLYNEWYMLNNWLIKLPSWSLISLVGI